MPAQGWKGYLGAIKEATYGTKVIPTAFGEFQSEGIKLNETWKTVKTINGTRYATKRVPGPIVVAGPIVHPVVTDDFVGLWLKDVLGNETYTLDETGVGKHVFVPQAANGLPGISLQIGRDDTSIAANIWAVVGGHVKKIKFSGKADAEVMCNVDFVGQNMNSGETNAAGAVSTLTPLMMHTGTFTINGVATNITDFELDIEPTLRDARRAVGSRLILAPQPGPYTIKGSMTFYLDDLTQVNNFLNGTAVGAIDLTILGPTLIGATKYPTLEFTMSTVYYDGETPTVAGPGEIMLKVPFESVNATAANLLSVTLRNTKTAAY